MKIIAIHGKAGSGKDTVADYLCKTYGYYKASLAEPLKEFCRDVFGFSEQQLYGSSSYRNTIDPRYGVSPREALQKLGTDWGRSLYPNIWIDYLFGNLEGSEGDYIITDCRFENEASEIRRRGGKIIHLTRGTSLEGAAGQHASEAGISIAPEDIVIDNRGTLEELWIQLDKLSEQL